MLSDWLNLIAENPGPIFIGIGVFLLYAFYKIVFTDEVLETPEDFKEQYAQVAAAMKNTQPAFLGTGLGDSTMGAGMRTFEPNISDHVELKLLSSSRAAFHVPTPGLPAGPTIPLNIRMTGK